MTDIDHYENAVNDLFRAAATSKKLDRSALVEAVLAVVVELRHLRDQQPTEQVTDLSARVARLESLAASPDWGLTEDERDDLDTPRVCVTHQRHIPCRHGSDDSPCEYSDRPEDVELVREHHAESGPVRPCEATSTPDALRDPQGLEGREKGAEPLTEEPPVGEQVVDSDPLGDLRPGDLLRRTKNGYEVWNGDCWEPLPVGIFRPFRLATDADREQVGLPRDQWPSRPPKPNTDFLLGSIPPRTPGECDDCGSRTLGPDEIAVKVPKCADVSDWLLAIADALEAQEGR